MVQLLTLILRNLPRFSWYFCLVERNLIRVNVALQLQVEMGRY